MDNGEWGMENEGERAEWRMANGKWRGEWIMDNREWRMEGREKKAGKEKTKGEKMGLGKGAGGEYSPIQRRPRAMAAALNAADTRKDRVDSGERQREASRVFSGIKPSKRMICHVT